MKHNSDTYYMKLALEEAIKARDAKEVPVGAVLVSNGTLIARAHNQTEMLNDVTAHAEILAITSAMHNLQSKYLQECSLYVSLEPCAMCAGAIGLSLLGKLVFAATDPKRGYRKMAPGVLHPKTDVISGIFEKEAGELLKDFFRQKR